MKIKSFVFIILACITINANSQKFNSFSGTVRIGGGLYGTMFSCFMPAMAVLLNIFDPDFNTNNWQTEQHTIYRFFNIGGDILVLDWSMTGSNTNIELHHPIQDYQADGWGGLHTYTTYIGYYFNWKSHFSRWGGYLGADYEWRNFLINDSSPYPVFHYNKIHSLVPSIGLRFRLLSPMTEIQGFPFNIVIEAGVSYIVNIKYKNDYDYGLDALNNGFRPMFGVAVTTNRFGSIHLRWTKDMYNLFNKDYMATDGFLYNNTITNNFSCISIGWAIFL